MAITKTDAGQRTLRTFLQGLAAVVSMQVLWVVNQAVTDAGDITAVDWTVVGASVLTAAWTSFYTYLAAQKFPAGPPEG